ncbi:hypothetical protein TSOC_008012 [Tetrabaena socialis]|uniref:Uncharacterized protein n=1 Tax=Tetrabaena socialis TaxID=47790 RepID=A0A2J7ZZL7_9CHLO|nr:hypothetical protein TSOC_008012 [Tetrabaena socialis]|eukprot:PNH05709.1 hypothetical protein TSOC_008012 [Tetrabaena socialis]
MNASDARDARRVVQVLVPAIPPPVLDYVFASIAGSAAASRARGRSSGSAPPPPRYTLRRVDSEDCPLAWSSANAASNPKGLADLRFDWVSPDSAALPQSGSSRRR